MQFLKKLDGFSVLMLINWFSAIFLSSPDPDIKALSINRVKFIIDVIYILFQINDMSKLHVIAHL